MTKNKIILLLLLLAPKYSHSENLNINQQKQNFFNFMQPLIVEENSKILELRKKLFKAKKDKIYRVLVSNTAHNYKLKWSYKRPNWKELLRRVDAVASDLALAQAANESDWGRSRFAKEAHNYFGQWCYTKNCGLIPKQRPLGATYEVKKFRSVKESVKAYLNNINTNPAYAPLRRIRAKSRALDRNLSAIRQASGLILYSERHNAYVRDIQEIIRENRSLMQH